jgi:hypothetical protein
LNVITPKIGFGNSDLPGVQNNVIGPPPRLYIDNQALEGFIDFFKKQNCLSGCSHCDYCQRIANKVIQFDREEVDEYIAMLNASLDNLASSRIFKVKAGVRKRLR